MTLLYILLGVLLFLLLLLCLPISYAVSIDKKRASATIGVVFGLYKKTFDFDFEEEKEKKEETKTEIKREEPLLSYEEGSPEEWEKAYEEAKKDLGISEEAEKSSEKDKEKKDKKGKEPSYWKQFLFAYENGLLREALRTLSLLVSHSAPSIWRASGKFGMEDPMKVGIICGWVYAFFLKEVEQVEWVFTESVCTLQIEGKGRVVPIYVLYIALRLLLGRPAREFWRYREGRVNHG